LRPDAPWSLPPDVDDPLDGAAAPGVEPALPPPPDVDCVDWPVEGTLADGVRTEGVDGVLTCGADGVCSCGTDTPSTPDASSPIAGPALGTSAARATAPTRAARRLLSL
jgi:hypothetical protein